MALKYCICFVLLVLLQAQGIVEKCRTDEVSANTNNPEKSVIPKWAIIALVKPDKVGEMSERNLAIVRNIGPYAKKHDITIIFFSELKFSMNFRENMLNTFSKFSGVRFIDTSSRQYRPPAPEKFGYKYMCKFFSVDVYEYLIEFDYYMRCDSDCYLRDLAYDALAWVEQRQAQYVFAMRKLEAHGPTKQTIPGWVKSYTAECQVQPRSLMDRPLDTCFNFYNNWHIGSVSFFNRPDVRYFLLSANSSGFILTHRWGDSTVQAYAVRLFADPSRLLQVIKDNYFPPLIFYSSKFSFMSFFTSTL